MAEVCKYFTAGKIAMRFFWICSVLVLYGNRHVTSTQTLKGTRSVTSTSTSTTAATQTITDCDSPALPNGKVKLSNGTFIGSVATFTCDENYYIIGTCEQNTTSDCLAGNWSVPTPSCVSKGDGISFSISKNPFIENSYDNIVMMCHSSLYRAGITVDQVELRRKLQGSSTWDLIAALNSTDILSFKKTNNLAKKSIIKGNFSLDATLSLIVNESVLLCEDEALYQCHVSYQTDQGQCYSERNKQFKGFFFPKNVGLEGKKNGHYLGYSNSNHPAQFKIGDTLELNCTAQIGNNPTVTITWLSTTQYTDGKLVENTFGTTSQNIAGNYNSCQYTRSATLTHVIDTTDFSTGNLSYSCRVPVVTPDLQTKDVDADRLLKVEIYKTCPRPSPEHGSIALSGTQINKTAELSCDQGYKRSTGFATCTSSGQWDTAMKCDPVDCKNFSAPLHGIVNYQTGTVFNDIVEILCEEGFQLNGGNSSVCQADGNWNNMASECILTGCKMLPPLAHGFVTMTNLTNVNSTALFSCFYGYHLQGNDTSTCYDEGWDTVLPLCLAIECPTPSSPANGYISIDNGKTEVNDTITFSCYAGYTLMGTEKTECILNATWQDVTPTCVVKNCSSPSVPTNGYIATITGYAVNSTADISCNAGYNLTGNGIIQCMENATWSTLSANCSLIVCPSFQVLVHGRLFISSTNVNDTAAVLCDLGYVLDGSATVECQENGKWNISSAKCIPKNCSSPSVPKNGYIGKITGYAINSTAVMSCNTGYNLTGNGTIRCTENATWSTLQAVCSKLECPLLQALEHGYVNTSSADRYVNDTAAVVCDLGYVLDGSAIVECQENGTWDISSAICIPKNCTYPLPPENGFVSSSTGLSINSTAVIACNAGYNLTGNGVIKCAENATWSILSAHCTLIECSTDGTLAHGSLNITSGKRHVNDSASVQCDLGYVPSDSTESAMCTQDGTWDTSTIFCIAKNCTQPTPPQNGVVASITGFSVNSTAIVSCNIGYQLTGYSKIQCINNATWSPLSALCTLIECNLPQLLEHGMLKFSNSRRNFNDSATVVCDPGYEIDGSHTAVCNDDGTWDIALTRCIPRNCSMPVNPLNGIVQIIDGYSVNSTATVTCVDGYDWTGETEIVCRENSLWSDMNGTCAIKECKTPKGPKNGSVTTLTRSVFNSTAVFKCDKGFNLQGTTTSTCTSDGNWTSEVPLCLSTECQKLPKLDYGTVNLSSGNLYQSNGHFSCDKGYDLYGFSMTTCLSTGNWTHPVPSCIPKDCGNWTFTNSSWSEFSFISYSSKTHFPSTAISFCREGFQINSTMKSLAATCTSNGTWSVPSPPLCVAVECPPIIEYSENITITYSNSKRYTVNSTATFKCQDPASTINGYETVSCLSSGKWTGQSPTCIKIEKETLPCPDEKDFRGNQWNKTQPGKIGTMACPKNFTGEISRQCTTEGKWQSPDYNCVRKDIDNVEKQIEAIKEHPSEEVVSEALNKLNNITKPKEEDGGIYSGEIEKVTSILDNIASISLKTEVTSSQAQAFMSTTSNLLDTSNTESWKAVSHEADSGAKETHQTDGAAKILDVVSRYSDAVTASLTNSSNQTTTVAVKNLVLHVAKVDPKADGVSFPSESESKHYKTTSSFHLPTQSLKGVKHVSSVLYKNLTGLLPSTTVSDGKEQNSNKRKINSAVIAVKIQDWEKNNNTFRINLTLGHFKGKFDTPLCGFWIENKTAWGNAGCKLKSSSSSESVCECDHLTNFAILMSPWEKENVETKAIDIISTVGCSISLAALLITIIAHIALWRYVKSDRVVILINLSISLVISYAIFLGGVDRTENKDACTAVAVLLQYIYLVVFFLMLAEGIEISVNVLYVFTTASRLKWLLPAAWLIPAVIVGISLGATQLKGYGNEQFCWLSVEGGLIWGFVAPAFIIILVNFVLLILILRAAFGASTLAQKSKTEKTKAGVKCLCVLLPIMGCTWVIGIFYVNKQMAWIQYVFAVCNSLQGLVIFLFHCAFNKQIRIAIERRRKKYASSMLSTVSTTKRFSMPRASTQSSLSDSMDMSQSLSRNDASFKNKNSFKRNNSELSGRNNYDMISSRSPGSSLLQKRL